MINIPKTIYLQVGDEDDLEDVDFDELVSSGEVTWCADQIFSNDIEFTLTRDSRKAMKGRIKCKKRK